MVCQTCKSEDFNEGKLKLKNGEFQIIMYCADCGQIMSRKAVSPLQEPKTRKSWAERKADSASREATTPIQLTWAERKKRKDLHTTQSSTASPVTSSEDDGSIPF